MTPAEAQTLLSMAAAFDNRKPDPDAAKAWAAALDGLPFDDCRLALIEHYKSSTEWLMPAVVRTAVRRVRAKRIAEHPHLTPPPGLDNEDERRWFWQMRQRIANGETFAPDQFAGELVARPDLRALVAAVAATTDEQHAGGPEGHRDETKPGNDEGDDE